VTAISIFDPNRDDSTEPLGKFLACLATTKNPYYGLCLLEWQATVKCREGIGCEVPKNI